MDTPDHIRKYILFYVLPTVNQSLYIDLTRGYTIGLCRTIERVVASMSLTDDDRRQALLCINTMFVVYSKERGVYKKSRKHYWWPNDTKDAIVDRMQFWADFTQIVHYKFVYV